MTSIAREFCFYTTTQYSGGHYLRVLARHNKKKYYEIKDDLEERFNIKINSFYMGIKLLNMDDIVINKIHEITPLIENDEIIIIPKIIVNELKVN